MDHPNILVDAFDQISIAKGVMDAEDIEKANSKNSSGND